MARQATAIPLALFLQKPARRAWVLGMSLKTAHDLGEIEGAVIPDEELHHIVDRALAILQIRDQQPYFKAALAGLARETLIRGAIDDFRLDRGARHRAQLCRDLEDAAGLARRQAVRTLREIAGDLPIAVATANQRVEPAFRKRGPLIVRIRYAGPCGRRARQGRR